MKNVISNDWVKPIGVAETLSVMDYLSLMHAHQGGEKGLKIAEMISNRDYKGLCTHKLDLSSPFWSDKTDQLYHCRQALAFYTKLEDLDIGIDKEQVAWESFCEAEQGNRANNAMMRRWISPQYPLFDGVDANVTSLFFEVREKFQSVLGKAPVMDKLKFKFGPGATTTVPRRLSCPSEKLAEQPTCSSNTLHSALFPEIVRSLLPWLSHHAKQWSVDEYGMTVGHWDFDVSSGKLVFVAKNAGTLRAIDTQPTLTGLVQLGIGDAIEKCLLRVGVDIRDQSRNQELARLGSTIGHIATIDLRNASNTVWYMLVKFLSRTDWFDLLNAGRTPCTEYNGTVYDLHMFSAMGNGYTFPLETLIFWSIVSVVCKDDDPGLIGVYGDDIICPAHKADDVVTALKLFGFQINLDKSFLSGPFRESCGSDYYLGTNVRPYHQKHLVSGETLFVLHNFYVRRGLLAFAKKVKALIPKGVRIYGPDGFGDGHLLADDWPKKRLRKSCRYVTIEAPFCNIEWLPPTQLQTDWVYTNKKYRVGDGYAGVVFQTYARKGRAIVNTRPCDVVTPTYLAYNTGRVPLVRVYWRDQNGNISERTNSEIPLESTPVNFAPDGRPLWDVPGSDGYETRDVYTLVTSN